MSKKDEKKDYYMRPETRDKMSRLMSERMKKYWSNLTEEERAERAKKASAGVSIEERKRHAERMKTAWSLLKEIEEINN